MSQSAVLRIELTLGLGGGHGGAELLPRSFSDRTAVDDANGRLNRPLLLLRLLGVLLNSNTRVGFPWCFTLDSDMAAWQFLLASSMCWLTLFLSISTDCFFTTEYSTLLCSSSSRSMAHLDPARYPAQKARAISDRALMPAKGAGTPLSTCPQKIQ